MKVSDIKVGKRHRNDLGDIDALAASIRDLGLLHPVVVTVEDKLVAGERRLAAVRKLGWSDVNVTIATTIAGAAKALRAERDENLCRKDFEPGEAVALAEQLEEIERPLAADRQRATRFGGGKFTPPSEPSESGKTRDRVAEAVGMSPPTLAKAKAVVAAAREHPETYGSIATEMNQTGKVTPAYNRLSQAASEPDAPPVNLPHKVAAAHQATSDGDGTIFPMPPKPTKHRPSGGEVWCKWIAECQRALNDTRDAGGIEGLVRSWAPGEKEEYIEMLRGFRDAADGWITILEKQCETKRKRVG